MISTIIGFAFASLFLSIKFGILYSLNIDLTKKSYLFKSLVATVISLYLTPLSLTKFTIYFATCSTSEYKLLNSFINILLVFSS